jgi:hypothetical protein
MSLNSTSQAQQMQSTDSELSIFHEFKTPNQEQVDLLQVIENFAHARVKNEMEQRRITLSEKLTWGIIGEMSEVIEEVSARLTNNTRAIKKMYNVEFTVDFIDEVNTQLSFIKKFTSIGYRLDQTEHRTVESVMTQIIGEIISNILNSN